jgi:hypothetical protein
MSKFNLLPPLRKWVIENKYFIKTSDTKENKSKATHFLLDGGLWKIPLNDYQTFLQLLSKDLQNGLPYYISENRSDIFRFVCDLDFYDDSEITLKQIERVVNKVQEVITEFYGTQTVIICGTNSKKVQMESVEYTKTGFHLVWPKIWITVEKAKELRLKIITKLTNHFGQRELINSWEDVVDLAIYEDNGLRMIGCRKMAKCKICKGKDKECEKCSGTGRVDEGRVYKPVSVLDSLNEDYFKSIQNDYYVMLLETSIYNYNSFDETKCIKDLPITCTDSTSGTKLKSKKMSQKTIDSTSEAKTKIENFIRKNFKQNYSKINIKKVTKSANEMYFVETDDNFCMNVNRNHTSSGIYFQVKRSGISQRCFCKKQTTEGRINGVCKEYCSKETPLSKCLETFLFGSNKTSKKKNIINYNIIVDSNNSLINCKQILFQLEKEILNK